jgi:shikimate dehydrogenase
MEINKDTKFIARIHKSVSPRTLNIYNPYFQDNGINAVYGLFVNEDPKVLIEGVKSLNFAGGILAGFEHDADVPGYLDELEDTSKVAHRVGYLKNINGKLVGGYSGGKGLYMAIKEKVDLNGKDVVLVGSGTICKTLLFEFKQNNIKLKSLIILNRTFERISKDLSDLGLEFEPRKLEELAQIDGEVLINTTFIGGRDEDTVFTDEIVKKYKYVVDVTFEKETTNLMKLALKNNLVFVTGKEMFAYYAAITLSKILDLDIKGEQLLPYVIKGLSEVV